MEGEARCVSVCVCLRQVVGRGYECGVGTQLMSLECGTGNSTCWRVKWEKAIGRARAEPALTHGLPFGCDNLQEKLASYDQRLRELRHKERDFISMQKLKARTEVRALFGTGTSGWGWVGRGAEDPRIPADTTTVYLGAH